MCHNFSPQDTKERDDDKNTELDEQGLPTRRHTTSLTLDPETGKQVFKIEKTTEFNSNNNGDGNSKIDSGKNDNSKINSRKNDDIVNKNTNVKPGTSWTQWLGSWVI